MKPHHPSFLKSMAWANLFLLSITLSAPAFAADPAAHGGGADPGGNHGGRNSGGGNPNPPPPLPAPGPDLGAARSAGESDTYGDGGREGQERGQQMGQNEGQREGRSQGFDRCAREESTRAHDQGFQNGFNSGQYDGNNEGNRVGDLDGQARGINEGQADGIRRADNDSDAAASPLGSAQGYQQGSASDASDRGARDGTIAGDAQALADAKRVDYARGRQDLNQERFAESVQNQDEILQKAAPQIPASLPSRSSALLSTLSFTTTNMSSAGPDYRYLSIRRNYPTAAENSAYADGARSGYSRGFSSSFSGSYDQAYRGAFQPSVDIGCSEARSRDYSSEYRSGQTEGHDRGYRQAYDQAYAQASNNAYSRMFGPNSQQAYSNNYDSFYRTHFEQARSAAYAARVSELYNAAFEAARAAKYNENYPTYAQNEYRRGRADETEDFRVRPIRLLSAESTETILNGIQEPGEPLRLHIQLRNFSANELRGSDVQVEIQALDTTQSVITEGTATLVKAVRAKSVTDVREALEFRMNENAVGRVASFNVKLSLAGKPMQTISLDVRANFLLQLQLAEAPTLKEGIAMPIRLKVTNVGKQATMGRTQIRLSTKPNQLEVAQPVVSTGVIAAGESTIVEFSAVARSMGANPDFQLGFAAQGNGRRIGLLDLTQQIPVINDYRITLNDSSTALRSPGVVRLTYQIRNISQRLMYKSLQVKVRFLESDDANNFVVIGPQTQYLMPMDQGESVNFMIPVLVKAANNGAIVEIEVQEDGQTVVIHRADFRKAQQPN